MCALYIFRREIVEEQRVLRWRAKQYSKSRAGLLHKDRVGDQDKGRSLDTLKDEKDRGITIKAAAVTLDLSVRESILSKVKETENFPDTPAKESSTELVEIYVGNLPHYVTSERHLATLLEDNAVPVSESCIDFHAKRSYAILKIHQDLVACLLELDGRPMEGTALRVEIAGESAMNRLQDICTSEGIQMPSITVQNQDDLKFTGTAVWPAMGEVMIQAPGLYDSRKIARQAAAQECVSFYQLQKDDHVWLSGAPSTSEERDDSSGSTRESESESQSSDGDNLVPIVMNLIDSPGHIDFNAEVTAALRVSDGALVVVDAVEGMAVQTQEVLIQALREGVKPVLMLNKVDRLFIDKQFSPEEVYDRMQRVTDDINSFIEAHQLDDLPDQRVSFEQGSVCFGSGYFGWSCSVETFVQNKEAAPSQHKQMSKFLSKRENFIKYMIKPILRMHRLSGVLPLKKDVACIDRIDMINSFLADRISGWTGRRLFSQTDDVSTIKPRKLLKKVMMAWLPAADALVDMIAAHVPSPVVAQRMRAPLLYSGSLNDASGQGIRNCDASAPAVVYISKMAPSSNSSKRLTSFGRVFSGTIRPGDTLRALRTDGSETKAKIAQIKLCGIGGRMITIPYAEAGQLVALEGVDEALRKAGTLTSAPEGHFIRHMTFAVTPVMQHSVKPVDKRNLTKMVTAFHQVVNADATALFFKDHETQEYILAGTGELHIEVLVSTFMQDSGIDVELSEPIVAYREGLRSSSTEAALAKSDNKHNRIWIKASPLSSDLVIAMSTGNLVGLDSKTLAKELVAKYGWSRSEASRIWTIGPEPLQGGDSGSDVDRPTCMLVDSTFGLQIPDDAKSNIVSAFKQVVRHGVLVNAPMQGVRFDLTDARFHTDSVHRRPNSVVPAAVRAMKGAFLMAEPSVMEPLYKVDVTGSQGTLNSAYSILGQRGGVIIDATSTLSSDLIQALVPVRRAFGIAGELRLGTHGHAHTSCLYSGMRMVPVSEQGDVIVEARTQKHLGRDLPKVTDFVDRL